VDERTADRWANVRVRAGAWLVVVLLAACQGTTTRPPAAVSPAHPSPTPQTRPLSDMTTTTHRVHAGFPGLPPAGTKPSEPTTGTLALVYDGPDGNGSQVDLSVYTDGRMIWQRWSPRVTWNARSAQPLVIPHGTTRFETGYVWQRLTRSGVAWLRSAILSSGLFDGRTKKFHTTSGYQIEVRTRRRMAAVWAGSVGGVRPTTAQFDALHAVETLMADPGSGLPRSDWADRRIRAFVPACYSVANERGGLDLSKLPAVARDELRMAMPDGNASGGMTTNDARTLFRSLVGAGYDPIPDSAAVVGFRLPPADTGSVFDPIRFGFLHLSPCLPG